MFLAFGDIIQFDCDSGWEALKEIYVIISVINKYTINHNNNSTAKATILKVASEFDISLIFDLLLLFRAISHVHSEIRCRRHFNKTSSRRFRALQVLHNRKWSRVIDLSPLSSAHFIPSDTTYPPVRRANFSSGIALRWNKSSTREAIWKINACRRDVCASRYEKSRELLTEERIIKLYFHIASHRSVHSISELASRNWPE